MIYKRVEVNIADLMIKYYSNKRFSKKYILNIESGIDLELKIRSKDGIEIRLDYNVVDNTNGLQIIQNKTVDYCRNAVYIDVIRDIPFEVVDKNLKKNYTILLNTNKYKEKDDFYIKHIKDRAYNNFVYIQQNRHYRDMNEVLRNLFYYEEPSNKGMIALIYYYLYFKYNKLDTLELKEIVNKKAEFLGFSCKQKKIPFKDLVVDIEVKKEEEKIETFLSIINSKLSASNLMFLLSEYYSIFKK